MKINIWINKKEVISGNITKYYTTEPVSNLKDPDKYETVYVQVQITQDEFAKLEDNGEWWNNDKDVVATLAIYKEFPEYKDMKLGDFENWFNNLSEDKRKIFSAMQGKVQNNKRKN